MILLNIVNYIAVKGDREFNDVNNKLIGIIKKQDRVCCLVHVFALSYKLAYFIEDFNDYFL